MAGFDSSEKQPDEAMNGDKSAHEVPLRAPYHLPGTKQLRPDATGEGPFIRPEPRDPTADMHAAATQGASRAISAPSPAGAVLPSTSGSCPNAYPTTPEAPPIEAPSGAIAATAPPPLPPPVETVSPRLRTARRVCLVLVALAAGYLLLALFVPRTDFFNLMHRGSGVGERGKDNEVEASASEEPLAESQADEVTPVHDSATPPEIVHSEPSAAERPPEPQEPAEEELATTPLPKEPTRESTEPPDAIKQIKPLALLPRAAQLPATSNAEARTLAKIGGESPNLRLEFLDDLSNLDADQRFVLEKLDDAHTPRWQVRLKRDGAGPDGWPIAQYWLAEGALHFKWMEVLDGAPADQLRNGLLQISAGGENKVLAMREPTTLPPVTVRMDRKTQLHAIDAQLVPNGNGLEVEILGVDHLPVNARMSGGESRARVGRRLSIDFSGSAGAAINLRLVRRGNGPLMLELRPVYKPGGREFDLTTTRVATARASFPRQLASAETNASTLTSRLASLQSQYNALRGQRPRSPVQATQRTGAMTRLSRMIQSASSSLAVARRGIPELRSNLDRLDELERIVAAMHQKAQLHYRIVAHAGRHELEIARSK